MHTPKICFITGSRADYGIMAPIMRLIKEKATLQVIATNMHLSPLYGSTWREIEADGFRIDARVEMLSEDDDGSPASTVRAMGREADGMADALARLRPDAVVILGDRYEMLTAASAALIFGIPIVHLHGGETTLGAYDDSIRHAITQLASLHLTSTEEYRQRVISMGKDPSAVHYIGSPAADELARFSPMPLEQLENDIGFALGERYIVATYHPATMEPGEEASQTQAFLDALASALPDDVKVLFTLPNSDSGGLTVRRQIEEWCAARPERARAVASLGARRYHSAVAHSLGVAGNSSSGLIEAPSLGVPTLNVGNRQAGRARGLSVIDCGAGQAEIESGLRRLLQVGAHHGAPEGGAIIHLWGAPQTVPARDGYSVRRLDNPYHRPGTVSRAADLILRFATHQ